MMAADPLCWRAGTPGGASYAGDQHPHPAGAPCPGGALSLARTNSAVDMRQLTQALADAREGCGAVRQALLSAAFRPRLPGLTKIVSKLSKEGSWRKALEVFEASSELGLAPDTALTNAAISACDKGGRWTTALAIFEGMDPAGLCRDAITYSSVISALAKGKQWAAALQVFGHMQAAGVQADVVTCCSLINALERGGQWQLAEQLFLEMCTADEGDDGGGGGGGGGGEGLGGSAVAAAAAAAAAPLKRSHTTPSSALLGMWGGGAGGGAGGGRAGHGGLCPVDEIGSGAALPAELDLELSLSAQQDILESLVGGRDEEAGGGAAAAPPAAQSPQAALSAKLDALEAKFGAVSTPKLTSSEDGGIKSLSSAFSRAAAVVSPDPLPAIHSSDGGGTERTLSASAPAFPNPFAAVAAGEQGSGGLSSGGSGGSSLARALSLGGGSVGSGGGLSISARPFIAAVPPSRLQRGALGREGLGGGPAAAAAAAHLRRAISCFPSIDHGAVGSSTSLSTYSTDSGTPQTPSSAATAASTPPPVFNFSFSHAARVAPNRVCCNALLAAYARAKPPQWQKALHLLAAMWTGGPSLTPDVVSYNTAIKACANAFQLGRAMELYHEMRRNGVAPNATTYAAVVGAAADAGAAEPLRELAAWLDGAPPEVAAPCANALVAGLAKVGLWDEAVARFERFLAAAPATGGGGGGGGGRPGSHFHGSHGPHGPHGSQVLLSTGTFNTIMAGHLAAGDAAAARRTFSAMRPAGAAPNLVSYNTVLAALARLGAWTEALDVLNAALAASNEGVHPNAATFTAALTALAKGAEAAPPAQRPVIASQAVQVFNAMRSPGVTGGGGGASGGGCTAPYAAAYGALIAVLHATGHSAQVVAVHGMMVGDGIVPDTETAGKVLSAAAATGQPGKAVEVADALQLQGAAIDPAQLSPLLSACVAAGAWELAAQLAVAAGRAAAPPALNFVLRSALDAGDFRASMETLRLMQEQGAEVDGATAARILGGGSGEGSDGGGDTKGQPKRRERDENDPKQLAAQQQHIHVAPMASVNFTPGDGQPADASGASAAGGSEPTPAVPRTTSTGHPVGIESQNPFPITPQPQARRSRGPGSADGTAPLGPLHAQHAQQEGESLTLDDTNAMLEAMRAAGDVGGCVEVLRNMKLAGIAPDAASYRAVVAALVGAGQGRTAVETVLEGAAAGALQALPATDTPSATEGEAAGESSQDLLSTLDLRGCCPEVAAAVVIAWMLQVRDQDSSQGTRVKIVFGPAAGAGAAGAVDAHAARAEVHRMFTTRRSSFPAFAGLVARALPAESVKYSVEGPYAVLLVDTAALA